MKNTSVFNAYVELTKPKILSLVLVTTTLGYYLGGRGIVSYEGLLWLLAGAGMVCAGSGVLNNYLERDIDCKMLRTKDRPIPSGMVSPAQALNFGIILVLFGIVVLSLKLNLLTAFLSLLTAFLYVLVYTPMKRLSWLNTTIGSIPGALPPMGGWAAATNNLDFGAWALFFILFVWQHPHFFAIAWMYREDYKRGGFKMLPVLDPSGKTTFQQIIIFSIILIPVSILPVLIGISGKIYLTGALILACILLAIGINFAQTKSNSDARKLLKATVFYLPILLILIVLDTSF